MPITICAEKGCGKAARYIYCKEHGGRRRAEAEAQRERTGQRARAQEKPKGQAVPCGEGLSRFREETDEQREKRLAAERERQARTAAARAEREAAQKEWLSSLPNRGETNQSGTGTSKKSRKREKQRRKLQHRR